ncbi:MAG: hypothetical protein ACUVTP_12850 [Candidatus Fervidibacter sp.]
MGGEVLQRDMPCIMCEIKRGKLGGVCNSEPKSSCPEFEQPVC